MMLDSGSRGIEVINLSKSYGATVLFENINFTVNQGEFMVIVGPSGCGKSSLMRVIAGIEQHGPGQVIVDGRDVTNAHPGSRSLSMVFQDYALYPHMTVEKNLAFGLRARHVPRKQIADRVSRVARTVGLEDQLKKKPGQLSGGQRQRVALGRAMIQEPRAFLMDEPLSNLDAALRVQMRGELIDFHRRIRGTILYVTHDQVEAMTMGDRVAVMNRGRFEQVGSPAEIYSRPANEYVATFLGSPRMNIIKAQASSSVGSSFTLVAAGMAWNFVESLELSGEVKVGIRPEHLEVLFEPSEDSVAVTLRHTENLGSEWIVHVSTDTGEHLVARTPPGPTSHPERLWLRSSRDHLHVFNAEGAAIWHGSAV